MKNPTRILIVEDSAADVELAERAIRRSVRHCEFHCVETRKDFLAALQTFHPHIVLADYDLPRFNGIKAVRLTLRHAPLTPVIIWTGLLNEEVAVKCMQAGASDFIFKENIRRLAPAILHALEERQLLLERRQAEEQFKAIFENSVDGIFQSSPGGRFLKVNPAMASLYGYESPQDMVESVTDIAGQIYADPEQRARFAELLKTRDRVEHYEQRNRCKDGSLIWTSTSARVVRDSSGEILYYEGFVRNITARKEMEDLLKAERNLLRTLIDNLPDRIYAMDRQGRKILSNTADWKASGGKIMEDVIGKTDYDLYPTDLAERFWQLDKAVLESEQTVINHEEPGLDAQGNLVSILTSKIPLRDEAGRVTGLVGIGRDITERKQTEARLRQSENRYELVTRATNDVVWEWNPETRQLHWSENAQTVFGYSREEIGPDEKWWDDHLHPDDRPRVLDKLSALIAGEESIWREEYRFQLKNGSYAYISDRGYIERDSHGLPRRMIGAMSDITQRKSAEIERQALFEIMQGLAHTHDLQELLRLIHHSIARVIYAENFFVVLHQPETGLFEEIYYVDQYDLPGPPSRLEKSITSYVFRSGEPLLLTEARFEELIMQGEVTLIGTNSKSWLGVPLKTSGSIIGVMAVQDYETDNRYSEHDKDLLASIASQIALAIERKQAEMELQQKNDDLSLLNAVNEAVVRGENLDAIIELLAKGIGRIFSRQGNTIYSTIYMLSSDNQSIVMQKYYFSPEMVRNIEKLIGFPIPRIEIPIKEAGHFHKTMVSRQTVVTSGPDGIKAWLAEFTETAFLPPLARPLVRKFIPQIYKILNIQSAITVPLISEDETIGFLEVSGSGLFTDNDRKRIEHIGGQLVAAIQRQKANEKLRRSEEFLQSIQNALSASIAILDECGTIVQVNSAWREFGKQNGLLHPQSCVGLNYLDICDSATGPRAEEAPLVARAIRAVVAGQRTEGRIEYPCHGPKASRWFTLHITKFEDGDHTWVVLAHEDITERKHAEEELRHRARETSALLETSLALTDLDLKATLQTISTSAKDLFAADGCRIFLMEPDGETLRCVVALQEDSNAWSDLRIKLGQGVTGTVAVTGRAEIVNEMQNDPRAVQVAGTPEEQEAIMFAPLKERDRTIGVLSVRRVGVERDFQAEDLELLEAFAAMGASAVSNARLFEETQRRLAELEALYENSLAVGRLLEPRQIGERIIETFSHYLRWHHVTIRLRHEESDDLELVAFNVPNLKDDERWMVERHFNALINRVGQGLSGWVIQTGIPVRTGNVHAHPQYVHTQSGIRSGLYMPLKAGERIIGVISVESELADAFSEQDERLLATLASQAAIAFENARLYETVQKELSERKRAEDALRVSEAHYRELADSITDILFELDQNMHFIHWNKASEVVTGIPASAAIGKSMHQIFGESQEQTRIESVFEDVLKTRRSRTLETRLTVGDEVRSFEVNAYPSRRGVSVVAKDVTERKRTEIIMQKRFELMEYSAHHALPELIQRTVDEVSELTDSSIGFLYFVENDQNTLGMKISSTNALRLFNVPISEGNHRALNEAGVWADAVRLRRPLIHNDYQSLPNKKGLPEGHVSILREMVVPIIRNEKLVAVMGVGNKPQDYAPQDLEIVARLADYAWDIAERKQMEDALAQERNQLARRVEERTADLSRANSNLARALRVKDEFLANMSHELRTPLNAILGLSESLVEQIAGPLNEKQQKYITTISESGHHLLALINDILDLAKIEAGQITLDINKVDIRSVCQASLRMIKQLAQKKNQEVTLTIEDSVGLMWADERRLKQMIVNLLGNAVKFTPENGKIGLEVSGDEESNKITMTVWDTGIGIKPVDLERLFQPFVQLNSGLARETTGTGLGLALVAQMARLHGGSVHAFSEPGMGSRFSIVLPWEPALALDSVTRMRITGKFRAIKPDETKKPTILLVEDTKEVIMMIRDYLELEGYNLVTAQDGLDALVLANLFHPDLILMDIQMPRMDGFEATRRLRSEPQFKYTPIIALTALAMPNDRERCLAAGMNEYVSKPIHLKALVRMIQSCLFNNQETQLR